MFRIICTSFFNNQSIKERAFHCHNPTQFFPLLPQSFTGFAADLNPQIPPHKLWVMTKGARRADKHSRKCVFLPAIRCETQCETQIL